MLCKVFLVSLLLVAVFVQVLHASTSCTSAPRGSCQPMSIYKALSSPDSGHQPVQSGESYAISEDIRTFQDPFSCTSSTDSLPEVRNLSVSLFPGHTAGYYRLLLQWNSDGNSGGYYIQMLNGAEDPSSAQEYYKTRVNDAAVSSVLLGKVSSYPFSPQDEYLSIRVQPNSRRERDCVTLTVPVRKICEAFVFNQQCSQRIVHTPLNTSQFQIQTTLLSDEAQDLSLMSVHMSWESSDDNVIIALTANGQRTDCNIPGRNPPCFIVSNTNSVTISQLNSSVQYSVTLHKFDPSPCVSNLAHLFNGCGKGYCCRDYSQILLPPPTNTTPTHTPFFTSDAGTLSPAPHTTLSPDASHTKSENSRGLFGELSSDKYSDLQTVAIAVPLTLVMVLVLVGIVAVFLYKLSRKLKHPISPDCHVTTVTTPPSVGTVTSDTTLADIELASLSSGSSPPVQSQSTGYWYPPVTTTPSYVPWTHETNFFHKNDLSHNNNLSSSPSALVLYSPHTPKDEIEEILGTIVVGLSHHSIDAKSPDTCVESANVSVWLEKEVKNSTVLLVCNESLKKDWENERSSQLVSSLKQLLHGSVVDKGLSNFATVLMSGYGDSAHVPSQYLNAQKQFTVENIEDITDISHFVLKVPLYQPSL